MFDIGWDEMALVAVVALIVIGPKDLPHVLRQVGRWTRKARELAGEFQRGVDDMVRESELAELKSQVEKAADPNALKQQIEKAVDPTGDIAKSLEPPVMETKLDADGVPLALPDAEPTRIAGPEQPAEPPMADLPESAPLEAPRRPPEP